MSTPPSGFDPERALADLEPFLRRWIDRICPRWLSAQKDDLLQAARLRILAVARDSREADVDWSSSYLWRVAYSVTVDEIRRVARRRETPAEEDVTSALPSETGNPERLLRSREIGDAVRDCLATMIEPRRVAAALHLLGHTQKEVGALMSIDEKKANNLIHRGTADLRECLDGKGVTP